MGASLLASAAAFSPAIFGVRNTALSMADYDLDFGSNNGYVPASAGDGGQGQFGAVSPNNWRVPGTSPVGQTSYSGAADFKIDAFAETKPYGFTTKEAAYEELVGKMGYSAFLEATSKVLAKNWTHFTLHQRRKNRLN